MLCFVCVLSQGWGFPPYGGARTSCGVYFSATDIISVRSTVYFCGSAISRFAQKRKDSNTLPYILYQFSWRQFLFTTTFTKTIGIRSNPFPPAFLSIQLI